MKKHFLGVDLRDMRCVRSDYGWLRELYAGHAGVTEQWIARRLCIVEPMEYKHGTNMPNIYDLDYRAVQHSITLEAISGVYDLLHIGLP